MIKTYPTILFFSIVTFCFLSNCRNTQPSQTKIASPEDTLVQIPTEWMEKLKAMKTFENPPEEMIREFRSFLYPDTKPQPNDSTQKDDISSDLYINPLFVNLDESPEPELLMWIGYRLASSFVVIKKINSKWYLLHEEFAAGIGSTPDLKIDNTTPDKKIFYTNKYNSHGSGFGREFLNIFRIEDNRVLVDHKFILGSINAMGYFLSHQVNNTRIEFQGLEHILITYQYTFSFAGGSYKYLTDTTRKRYKPTLFYKPFLEGEESFYLKWDTLKKQYFLTDITKQKRLDIINQKITTVQEFCNAFKPALDSIRKKEGTHRYTKEILEALDKMNKEIPDEVITPSLVMPLPQHYYESRTRKKPKSS